MALQHWIPGEEVDAADFQAENAEFLSLIGQICQIFFGKGDFQAGLFGLVATVSGSTVTVGGANQSAYIAAKLCNGILAQAFNISPNSGSNVRKDILYGYGVETDVNPSPRNVRNQDTTITQQTVYQTSHDVSWKYVPGNADGSLGTAPANYYTPIVEIDVPPNGNALEQGNVRILLPTLNAILAAMSVASLNGQVGALAITSPDGSISINIANGQIQIEAQQQAVQQAVSSLNNLTGNVSITSPDNSITVTVQNGQIQIVAAAHAATVNSINGISGSANIDSPDNSVSVTESGENIQLEVPFGRIGDVTEAHVRLTGFSTVTLKLPQTLPAGTWTLYAEASIDLSNNSMTLTGSAASWEGASTVPDAQGSIAESVWLLGTSSGGNPYVTLTFTAQNGGGKPTVYGPLILRAVRTA